MNISPSVYVARYYHNGIVDYDYWGVRSSISATYFSDKGFWGSVSYSPPDPKELYWGGSIMGKSHSHNLSIQAGYSIGNFSCNVSVNPLYRYGRYEQITDLPGVNIINNSYSKSMGRSVSLSLKYVIDFGRKYPHGNDMYIESERVSSVR